MASDSIFVRSAGQWRGAPRLLSACVLLTGLALAVPLSASSKTIVGSPGPDRLVAKSAGGDLLYGGGGVDTLIGGRGNDVIYGVRSNNTIRGNGGDDYIEGGAGWDNIDGGVGNNTIYGSSGHDTIRAGDGNNYVDVGGAPDVAVLGNGNNVLLTGSGGGKFTVGNGNNTVYYGSGNATIKAGSGVNTFYLAGTSGVTIDCGGNPATTVNINEAGLERFSMQIFRRDRARNCPNITTFDGSKRVASVIARGWDPFNLIGTDLRDKLYGGHGGGTIDGKGGDNELWADHYPDLGGAAARARTTRLSATHGNNRIFGGRGTNLISAGNGDNLIRGGAGVNRISVGSGTNLIRLQGSKSTNTVTISGRGDNDGSYVESLANGKRPIIRCINGAKADIIYGNTRPQTTCGRPQAARSAAGKKLQIERTPGVAASDPVIEPQLQPGENGVGVARPNPA